MFAIGPKCFAGSWIDSLGNYVHVQDRGPLGLRASLARPNGAGVGLTLTICQEDCTWKCGHYDLIEQESSLPLLVWQDRRSLDRVTVWKRKIAAQLPQPGAAAGHAGALPWTAVCAAAPSHVTLPSAVSSVTGGIDNLSCVFGLPAPAADVAARASEDMRERVLQETLARLLKSKRSRPHAVGNPSVGIPTSQPVAMAAATSSVLSPVHVNSPTWPQEDGACEEELVPDWKRRVCVNGRQTVQVPALRITDNEEDLLGRFCRVFGLDLLARGSLYALEDDEASNVISSLQGRLGHVKNPSAFVMIAIKSVVSKVGRCYWGSQEAGVLQDAPTALGIGANQEVPALNPSMEQMPASLKVCAGSPLENNESGDESDDDEEDGEVLAVADPYMTEAPVIIDLVGDDDEEHGAAGTGTGDAAVVGPVGAGGEQDAEVSPSCFFEDAGGAG